MSSTGSFAEIVELGEVLSWLGAACRNAQSKDAVQHCTPSLSAYPSKYSNLCRIRYSFADLEADDGLANDSQGWRQIFRNPTIARGYPIAKSENNEPGLEMPLELAADLGQALYATTFKGILLLKGVCSALVPTKKTDNSVIWHYVLDHNLAYLAYNQALEIWDKTSSIDSACLKTLRHYVGWTKQSESPVGT